MPSNPEFGRLGVGGVCRSDLEFEYSLGYKVKDCGENIDI